MSEKARKSGPSGYLQADEKRKKSENLMNTRGQSNRE